MKRIKILIDQKLSKENAHVSENNFMNRRKCRSDLKIVKKQRTSEWIIGISLGFFTFTLVSRILDILLFSSR